MGKLKLVGEKKREQVMEVGKCGRDLSEVKLGEG